MADIEFNKNGVKISYRKYIANTAAGFVFYLFVFGIFTIYFPEWAFNYFGNVKTETATFLFIILFLLATALGEFISGLSWIFLGGITVSFYKWVFGCNFSKGFPHNIFNCLNNKNYKIFQFKDYTKFFGLNKNNWFNFYENLTHLYESSISLQVKLKLDVERIDSNAEFTRNLAFLTILFFLYSIISFNWTESVISLIAIFLCFIINAFEKNYSINRTFHCNYIYLLNKTNTEGLKKWVNVKEALIESVQNELPFSIQT